MANAPPAYDQKFYTINLTAKERNKQSDFVKMESRTDVRPPFLPFPIATLSFASFKYLDDILEHLTGDDVRHLLQAEDELTVMGKFSRIFPTESTFAYLDFMDVRYYNRLFDAWEIKYHENRDKGSYNPFLISTQRGGYNCFGLQESVVCKRCARPKYTCEWLPNRSQLR